MKGEGFHQKNKRVRPTYYACKNMDIEYRQREVDDFIFLWNEGHSFIDIHRYIKGYNHDRTQNELAVLMISLGEEERIEPRRNGIWGEF